MTYDGLVKRLHVPDGYRPPNEMTFRDVRALRTWLLRQGVPCAAALARHRLPVREGPFLERRDEGRREPIMDYARRLKPLITNRRGRRPRNVDRAVAAAGQLPAGQGGDRLAAARDTLTSGVHVTKPAPPTIATDQNASKVTNLGCRIRRSGSTCGARARRRTGRRGTCPGRSAPATDSCWAGPARSCRTPRGRLGRA